MSRRRLTPGPLTTPSDFRESWHTAPVQRCARRAPALVALVVLALMASLVLPVGPSADAAVTKFSTSASHIVDANDANQRVILAVQRNGTVGVRRDMNDGNGWSNFHELVEHDWQSANAAILGNGHIHVIAVSSSNDLFTTTAVLSLSSLMMLPLSLGTGEPWLSTPLQPAAVISSAILGLVCTAWATYLYYRVLRSAGPAFVSQMNYFIPIWALLIGVIFLDETIGLNAIVALVLILSGIFIAHSGQQTNEEVDEH